jgi:hypothetical protein
MNEISLQIIRIELLIFKKRTERKRLLTEKMKEKQETTKT